MPFLSDYAPAKRSVFPFLSAPFQQSAVTRILAETRESNPRYVDQPISLQLTRLLSCGAYVLLLSTVAPTAAFGGPDACVQVSGDNAWSCSGNQSDGIAVGSGGGNPPNNARTVTVENLNQNMNEGAGFENNAWAAPVFNIRLGAFEINTPGRGVVSSYKYSTGEGSSTDQTEVNISGKAITANNGNGVEVDRFGGQGKNATSSSGKSGGSGQASGQVFLSFSNTSSVSETTITAPLGRAIDARSQGGLGGTGSTDPLGDSGDGGDGGFGGAVIANTSTDVLLNGLNGAMILESRGGNGQLGKSSFGTDGNGGSGGASQGIALNGSTLLSPAAEGGSWTYNGDGSGFRLLSVGGKGGDGFAGGNGGTAGIVQIFDTAPISVTSTGSTIDAHAVWATSRGGAGGGSGKLGAQGGFGGKVFLSGQFNLSTGGLNSDGLVGTSVGGVGGSGSTESAPGGFADEVQLTLSEGSSVTTTGNFGVGVAAQSIGGRGGIGATISGVVSFGASGGSGGLAKNAEIENHGSVSTSGVGSTALLAHSIGGSGGDGGAAYSAFYSQGGTGAQGGKGGTVTVNNISGALTTQGHAASGIVAQSIGGAGGNGGGAASMQAMGGRSGNGSNASAVAVINSGTIKTGQGPTGTNANAHCATGCSFGISAQSIGGGGGNGGTTGGWFSVGGAAGGGGDGSTVNVTSGNSAIETALNDSPTIKAQSIGGGGGNGGSTVGAGLIASVAMGGSGGNGGNADAVVVTAGTQSTDVFKTEGARSEAILAQSIGGGGGRGGFAADAAVGAGASVSIGIGGTGGKGGDSGSTSVTTMGSVSTNGFHSNGVTAQSLGGGGGNGGFSLALSGSPDLAIAVGIGGKGSTGGTSDTVSIDSEASVSTSGANSTGLMAQSVGGGGGNGGLAVSLAASGEFSAGLSLGGNAAGGGHGGSAIIASQGTIMTDAQTSPGIVAQSIGGGGGHGGMAIDGAVTISEAGASLDMAIGGSGGAGGDSVVTSSRSTAAVDVTSTQSVTTRGTHSTGILAQSIGGGGGNGGSTIGVNVSTGESAAAGLSLGGGSGGGGVGAGVAMSISGDVSTSGDLSGGVLAQSIGGGGGNGGSSFNGTVTTGEAASLGVAVGGGGGEGGHGGDVTISTLSGNVATSGVQSDAVNVQSIGGGGGNGGSAIAGDISTSDSLNINAAWGGSGSGGGNGGKVQLQASGDISATGVASRGIVAQSIGGGGGSGGFATTGSFTSDESNITIGVTLGGGAGAGSAGGTTEVASTGAIKTGGTAYESTRSDEHGILAQSIGGGGGAGGVATNARATSTDKGAKSISIGVGGSGGAGAAGGTTSVYNAGSIATVNTTSHGILAQSIAGGGGAGGATATNSLQSTSSKSKNLSASLSVGGAGGGGAGSGAVTVDQSGDITVTGPGSRGVIAQSIAGGGGVGGSNLFRTNNSQKTTNLLTIGIGRKGGSVKSAAGNVNLFTSLAGSITTGASRSGAPDGMPGQRYSGHGILLQSIGGGGGDGGVGIQGDIAPTGSNKASADIGVGGKGGAGGDAGNIFVGASAPANGIEIPAIGSITTTDDLSNALFAQSIGGGGGTGGTGIQGDVKNTQSKSLTIGVGNFGGGAGNGGSVTLQSAFDVKTLGDGSKGIVAQSIGGGGGAGGTELSGDVSSSNDDGSTQIVAGVGLNGGGGGDGGDILIGSHVNSEGTNAIVTGQNAIGGAAQVSGGALSADGIFAQSIGGGGGTGGIGIKGGKITTETKNKAVSVNIGVGTAGGGGGHGGGITVSNTLSIDAYGAGSRGIVAQSIGGGGGEGGIGISSDITASSKSTADTQLSLGVGGAGGTGGDGGKVLVQTAGGGGITTHLGSSTDAQGQMHGIIAQSIGGGGGNGSVGMSGDITGSKNTNAMTAAIGGFGGSGGDGYQNPIADDNYMTAGVGVQSNKPIQTAGDNSVGILAQNIGGGGGNGAIGLSGKVDAGEGHATTIGIGGAGGSGGEGGSVYVNNLSTIVTGSTSTTADPSTNQSHGIMAQSIGGGGGTGSLTGTLVYGSTNSGDDKGYALTVGGLTSGGSGGEVVVASTADITTHDDASHAIVAQSIGGGGGGGSSLGGIGTEDASNTWSAEISVGGGGGAGDGGNVTINTNFPSVYTTHGDGAFGIFAQSIGGGGGIAGNAAGLNDSGDSQQTTSNADISLNIGGTGASQGNGGVVAINLPSDRTIITNGVGSIGAFAQSIGGGGGTGGLGAAGIAGGEITIGGSESANGRGGNATISNSGFISTSGAGSDAIAAHGIVAQSVGGGGGYGGTVTMSGADFGSSLSGMSLDNTSSGTSGFALAEIKGGGSVHTSGGQSVGVIAQSVGGGGGIAGSVEDGVIDTLFGSAGGTGKAGPATADIFSDQPLAVSTTGDQAHGLIVQSAGGAGTDTRTDTMAQVRVGGNIRAIGAGSAGVIAQSVGDGRGQVLVTVNEGFTVTGGTQGGVGVQVRDGVSSNRLNNSGTITTVDGTAGIAADYWGDAKLTINNSGTMTGKILTNGEEIGSRSVQEASPITLHNSSTGVVKAGTTLDVARFVNDGRLQIGDEFDGENRDVATTVVTGDYEQSPSGTLAINLDLGQREVDRLEVNGHGALAGQVEVSRVNIREGTFKASDPGSVQILQAAGGLTFDGLSVKNSVAGRYELLTGTDDELRLAWDIDFSNEDIRNQTNLNQDGLVTHLQELFVAGNLDENAADEASEFLAIETGAEFAALANSLSAEVYLNNQVTVLNNALEFGQDLMDCHARDGSYRLVRQDQCSWIDLGASRFSQDENSRSTGFDVNSYRIAAGTKFEIDPDLHVGLALAYVNNSLNMDHATSDGNSVQVGAMVERWYGPAVLAASLSAGYGSFDSKRHLGTGEVNKGDQKISNVSAVLRGGYTFEQDNWQITPRLDLGMDYVSSDKVAENSSNPFALTVSGGDDTFYWVRPSVEFAGEFEIGDGNLLRPELTIGLLHYIGDTSFGAQSRFAMTSTDQNGFRTEVDQDRTFIDIAAGATLLTKSNMAINAGLLFQKSDNTKTYGGKLQIQFSF